MGIRLDYWLDPLDLRQIESVDLSTVDRGYLDWYHFIATICFEIRCSEHGSISERAPLLISFPRDPCVEAERVWFSTECGWPLLNFAPWLYEIACSIRVGEELRLEYTESEAFIAFRRLGDSVEIQANYAPGHALVPLTSLRQAARAFLRRIIADFDARWPALLMNPIYLEIRGGLDREVANG